MTWHGSVVQMASKEIESIGDIIIIKKRHPKMCVDYAIHKRVSHQFCTTLQSSLLSPRFTEEQTEAQQDEVISPNSSQQMVELREDSPHLVPWITELQRSHSGILRPLPWGHLGHLIPRNRSLFHGVVIRPSSFLDSTYSCAAL